MFAEMTLGTGGLLSLPINVKLGEIKALEYQELAS
jgi:hypothetical protein